MVNHYVLPEMQHLKNEDTVKDVHFFESLEALMEIYLTHEDCVVITEKSLKELMMRGAEKHVPVSKR